MEILTNLVDAYGIVGILLTILLLILFVVQIVLHCRKFIFSKFDYTSRTQVRPELPAVSVIVPLFGEDEEYLKGNFRQLLSQSSVKYEVVAVYVGKEDAFYATLTHLHKFYKHLKTTHIDYTPQYPVTMRMALNLGIKSASNECVVITTPDTRPITTDWVYYMASGFMYGDIVMGFCNWESKPGLLNHFYRKYRFTESRTYLSEALRGHYYGACGSCLGFTKSLYFGVEGFHHLDLTAGEDDLFMQTIATKNNVCVQLVDEGCCEDKAPNSFHYWLTEIYRLGQTRKYYTQRARNAEGCELLCRVAFFVAAVGALVALPLELKLFAALLVFLRYITVSLVDSKTAAKVGQRGLWAWSPLFDFFEPWVRFIIRATQPKRINKWI